MAKRIISHQGVGHSRKDSTETILAVEPLLDEGHGTRYSPSAHAFGHDWLDSAQHAIEAEERRCHLAPRQEVGTLLLRRYREEFGHADAVWITCPRLMGRQHQ